MEEKEKINNLEINNVPQNAAVQKQPIMEGELTGYPSIDKPWLKYYPKELLLAEKKISRVIDRIKGSWLDPNEMIINYYDTKITASEFFDKINKTAKSLIASGLKKGDSIMASLDAVPEYLELFFACEIIGCSLKNHVGDTEEIINLINNDETIKCYITHDYLTESDSTNIYNSTNIKNIILVDPLYSFDKKNKLRANIEEVIKSKYSGNETKDDRNIYWDDFLEKGQSVHSFEENYDCSIRLFSAFTSGSTGKPKEVMHSSESIIGIINQLSMAPVQEGEREIWLHAMIPPIIVSTIIASLCYPLADGKVLVLDPYCKLEDLDLEMMHYKPSGWALVPAFFNVFLESNRIPKDYDMSHFKLFGFGAEPLTKKYIHKVQQFLDQHNCQVPLSAGYGQSEGGSGFTVAYGKDMILSGSAGIPYVDTVISIFEPNTTKELQYYEIGEVCKCGPGIMLGYSDKELTEEVLKVHEDGKLWLHTGDTGYMTKEGFLFVLGRKGIKVYPDKVVFPLEIENKISLLDGVKDAVVVTGTDTINKDFEVPYLFVVPEKNVSTGALLTEINNLIVQELKEFEQPKEIYIIDEKPIDKFKVDRKILKKKYNIL